MYKAPANNGVQQTKTFFPLWTLLSICASILENGFWLDTVTVFMLSCTKTTVQSFTVTVNKIVR